MEKFSILDRAKKEGRSILTQFESKKLLNQFRIPLVEAKLAKTKKEVVSLSQKIGFPLVLKIASPGVTHKRVKRKSNLGLHSMWCLC
jgi:acyl-CoA synthetase (NDP forming)